MRTITRVVFAFGFVGAVAGHAATAFAQYYNYPPPPPRPSPYYYGYRPCPPGYTVQGGACKPYRGAVGGGWNTWNGCPPGYTVQDGACQPYRGY
jgi:hypothetical protein